eukprot:110499-Pleurochrysis_carterae.AAC.1
MSGNRRGIVKSNTDSRKAASLGSKSSSPLCALHNAPSTVSRMKTCLARFTCEYTPFASDGCSGGGARSHSKRSQQQLHFVQRLRSRYAVILPTILTVAAETPPMRAIISMSVIKFGFLL